MRKILLSMAVFAATISIVSCDNAYDIIGNGDDNTILAFTENVKTKAAIIGNDTGGYQVVWSDDDSFKLGTEIFTYIGEPGETSGEFLGTVPDNGTYTAFYPDSYDGKTWPSIQPYDEYGDISFSPMTAEVTISDGKGPESIRFSNVGGFLRITATTEDEVSVKNITVRAAGLDAIILDCKDGVDISSDSTDFYIAMPVGTYKEASIIFTDINDWTCTKTLDIVINRSELTAVIFSTKFLPDGALPGKFIVGPGPDGKLGTDDDKMVHFSRGNLQARYSDAVEGPKRIWSFATRQYDHIGNNPGNTTIDNPGDNDVVDLFGWSSYARTITYGICTSTAYDPYSGNFLDWGTTIGNKETWRTLSKDEWKFLIDRSTVWRYDVTVMGCHGCLVLYPTGYDSAKMVNFHDKETYNTEAAYNAATEEGVVFLPPTGYREGSEIYELSKGFYWTSNAAVGFGFTNVYADGIISKPHHYGMAVRLVTNCE